MTEHAGNPTRMPVAIAAAVFVVAVLAFAAAFYLLDGMTYAQDLYEQFFGSAQAQTSSAPSDPPAAEDAAAALALPEDMPEEFALRVWQEQVDSQGSIERLAAGEVERIEFSSAAVSGDESTVDIVAYFADGTSAPGQLGFRRFSDVWYVEYLSGMREGETGGAADVVAAGEGEAPDTPLPTIEDVDIGVLNTIIEEQQKSAEITEEYATGVIEAVDIAEVVEGPGTVTLKIEMDETHSDGYGDVVMISKQIEGEPYWFIARFTKTAAQ